MQIKVLVACPDEHAGRALCVQLAGVDDGILGAVSAPARVLDGVASSAPDVVLFEFRSGNENGVLGAIDGVRRLSRRTRFMLLADSPPQHLLPALIGRGASGCLLRSSPPQLQAKAVRAVHQGETWFARAELLAMLRSHLQTPVVTPMPVDDENQSLTAREREILTLVGNAMSNKEVARHLNISDQTVKTHLHRIYVKLHRSGRFKALLSGAPVAPDWAARSR